MSRDGYFNDRWYTERWESMPVEMRERAVAAAKKAISDNDFELIRRKHAEHGGDWIHFLYDTSQEERDEMNALMPEGTDLEEFGWPETQSAHHFFGMHFRNHLRDPERGAGILDDDLPEAPYENGQTHKNWDDYYVAVIEAAAGLR